jgi:hypothetical protein
VVLVYNLFFSNSMYIWFELKVVPLIMNVWWDYPVSNIYTVFHLPIICSVYGSKKSIGTWSCFSRLEGKDIFPTIFIVYAICNSYPVKWLWTGYQGCGTSYGHRKFYCSYYIAHFEIHLLCYQCCISCRDCIMSNGQWRENEREGNDLGIFEGIIMTIGRGR